MEKWEVSHYEVLGQATGSQIDNLTLQHPFEARDVPLIHSDHVTTDGGTGNVHIAPGHGQDDYHCGLKYNLPITSPVLDNGCFSESVVDFKGEYILKAISNIIALLKDHHQLISHKTIQHSYPHCWRHKSPVIYRATPQWFISMDKQRLRENALVAITSCQWIPSWGQERITKMIEGRPDWCISRQRVWGAPLPFFIHKETKELHPKTPMLMEEVAKKMDVHGMDAWYEIDKQLVLGDEAEKYEAITDTIDVWFDAGSSHQCVLQQREQLEYPADLYLEGSDQHRGWFQSSLLTSVAINGVAPYKNVLTHGYTVDEHGHKMSKSLGNVIAPEKIVKTLGADILRLWVASTDYRGDVSYSQEIFNRIAEAYRRIRNTIRYLLSNLFDFQPKQDLLHLQSLLPLDKFAVQMATKLQQEILSAYDTYQFHIVYQKIHHFCTIEMGSFYLDVIKDRQYTCQQSSLARRSCQTAMYHITEYMVRWLAPILSFTAEEIWQCMPGDRQSSVFLTNWYDGGSMEDATDFTEAFWRTIMQLRDEVNRSAEVVRKQGLLGSTLEANITLYAQSEYYDKLTLLQDELRFVLIASSATVKPWSEKPQDCPESLIAGFAVDVKASEATKCIRCWHRRSDVGTDKRHPEICSRCIQNVSGNGEIRQIA